MCSSISSEEALCSVHDVGGNEEDIDDMDPDEIPLSAFSAPKCSTPVAKKAKDFVSSFLSPYSAYSSLPFGERI